MRAVASGPNRLHIVTRILAIDSGPSRARPGMILSTPLAWNPHIYALYAIYKTWAHGTEGTRIQRANNKGPYKKTLGPARQGVSRAD